MQCKLLDSFWIEKKVFSFKAACWSTDSSMLLFSCEDCSLLYSLRFLNSEKQELEIACDLSSISLFDNMSDMSQIDQTIINRYSIGGSINDICWDPSGQRLAVSFKSLIFNLKW